MRPSLFAAAALLLLMAAPAAAWDEGDLSTLKAGGFCYECNLAGADLSGIRLDGAELDHANLRGADLSGAVLTGASMLKADLRGAKLVGAVCDNCLLMDANLDGADLSDARFSYAVMDGASLKGTNVTRASLDAVGANLSEAIDHASAPAPSPSPAPTPTPAPPQTNRRDLRAGSVFLVAFGYCPLGSMEADGRALKIQGLEALYSLYGSSYGGDWQTTFNLPDMRAAVPLAGMRYCIVAVGTYPERP